MEWNSRPTTNESGNALRPSKQGYLFVFPSSDITNLRYFGHGSGEQYVKSTKLTRLPNTALTMLFGCSSGKLREAGDFEPWGTPYTYLLGGSPSLLANLWDVTDRDIDRLSHGVFSRWGLCDERPKSRATEEENFEPERGMSSDFGLLSIGERKKLLHASMRGKKVNDARKGITLTEALAKAREDCTLKYLNGAAPVIYGVPVFLENGWKK
jgi:separase